MDFFRFLSISFDFLLIFIDFFTFSDKKQPLSQITNRFDSVKLQQNPSFVSKKQKKDHLFLSLAKSSNTDELFTNRDFLTINSDIENLIKTLRNYLFDYKIRANEFFQKIDKNNDNLLSFNEFCEGFEKIGLNLNTGDFLDVFRYFDHDSKGSISIEEFFEVLFGKNTDKTEKKSEYLLEGKSMVFYEEKEGKSDKKEGKYDKKERKKREREKIFELITNMKKYKKNDVYRFFEEFEEKHQETIDFVEFSNLMEKMQFLITRGEAKQLFDFFAKNNDKMDKKNGENGKNNKKNEKNSKKNEKKSIEKTIDWSVFYDVLTETVDLESIKREILLQIQQKKLNLRDFFTIYDVNHDNSLKFSEFKLVLSQMIPELNFIDIYELFMEIDKTNDDKISYEEFERFLLSSNTFYTITDEKLENDIKFLVNFLRKSLKNQKKVKAKEFFQEFTDVYQREISVNEFEKIVIKMNSSLKSEEICVISTFFKNFNKFNEKNAVKFMIFCEFLDFPVDFFGFYYDFHDYLRNSNTNYDYLFQLADLDEDSKLSGEEFHIFLKEIQIKDINLINFKEIFLFLSEKNENFITKVNLQEFLENFEEKCMSFIDKKKIIADINVEKIDFQSIKHDKIAVKKLIFFKFSEVLPFLLEFHQFILKEFREFSVFEGKMHELFEDLLLNNNSSLVSKIQFKLRLLKFHAFFTGIKINKTIEILNREKSGNCDLEEFLYLMANFEEIFYSRLNKDEKIVRFVIFFINFLMYLS